MANEVRITVTGDSRGAEAALQRTERSLDDFAKKARGVGLALSAAGAIGVAAVGSAIKAAIEERQGISLLDQALRNVGTSYDRQKASIEALVEAQQRKTNFGDDAQRAALQKLVAISGDYKRSLEALPATLDLAAGLQIDLTTASNLVARALAGNTELFARYGLELREGATATEAMQEITRKFGGAAEAAADPLTQLSNRIGDVKEAFATGLLPAIEPILRVLEAFARALTAVNPVVLTSIAAIAAIGTAFAAIAGPILLFLGFLPAIKAGAIVLAGVFGVAISAPVLATVAAIAALVAVGVLLVQNWEFIERNAATIWNGVLAVLRTAFGPMVGVVNGFIQAGRAVVDNWHSISATLINIWIGIQNVFSGAVDSMIGAKDRLVGVFSGLAGVLRAPFDAITSGIRSAIDFAIGLINGAVDKLNAAIQAYNRIPILPDLPDIPRINMAPPSLPLPVPGAADFVGPLPKSFIDNAIRRINEQIPQFATGGIVPGPVGKPQLAVVHGGEEVIPVGGRMGRAGTVVNFHFEGISVAESRRQIGNVIRDIVADGGLVDVGLSLERGFNRQPG